MKRFFVKTFGALLIAAGLTLGGVVAPASAATSGSITPNTFTAGTTVSTSVTIDYTDSAPTGNSSIAYINMQSLQLTSVSCTTTHSTNFADCGVTSISINGSPAGAGTKVFRGNSSAELGVDFPPMTTVSSVSITFDPSKLTVLSTPTGSRNVIWQLVGIYGNMRMTPYTVSAAPAATVTFNANDGTATTATQSANSATALTANAFTRSGYTFAGWNTVAGGTGTAYADGASYAFASNITLYAQWTANSNGGSGGSSSSTDTGLATTGFDSMPYLVTGGVLTVLGLALFFLTRPRRVRR